jgi:hypothetical protein
MNVEGRGTEGQDLCCVPLLNSPTLGHPNGNCNHLHFVYGTIRAWFVAHHASSTTIHAGALSIVGDTDQATACPSDAPIKVGRSTDSRSLHS